MSIKESGVIDVGYPIYGAKFVNNKTIIVTGGGGEGNNGIPNKITAIKCSLKVSDKSKRLQKFREIVLPKNEDSPMCLDIAKDSVDNEANFSVFVGCNQSTQLLKSMNINNNLRKYVFTNEEHLRFVDAAQLEEDISGEGVGEYPKIVCLSSHNSVGCLMTSRNPSVIYIFNPDLLELNFKFKPERDVDILDFHLSPGDDGKTLCYITASSIETVSTVTGNTISSTNATSNKALAKYNLSKVRFIDDSNIILTASLKNGKGVSIFQYSIPDKKIIKQREVSSKIKGITSMDISLTQGLVALAGNDTSITVLRLSDFKTIKTFAKLHSFAITRVAFSPSGTKLASVSAANTLHVLKIPSNYSSGKSIVGTLVHYIFMAIIACLVAVFMQKFYENGQLEQLCDLSSHYGQVGFKIANEYGIAGYQFVIEKIRGENVDGDDTTKQYFKMDEWDDNESSQSTDVSFISHVETYSTETTEIASTILQTDISSNDNVDIREITKDIDEITKGDGINTETFLNDTNNYIEQATIINAPNASIDTVIESTAIETTELKASETDSMTENYETGIVSDDDSEPTTVLNENPDNSKERIQSNVIHGDKNANEDVKISDDDVLEDEEIEEADIVSENDDDSVEESVDNITKTYAEEEVDNNSEAYAEEDSDKNTEIYVEEESTDDHEAGVEEEAINNAEEDVEEEVVDSREAEVEEEIVDNAEPDVKEEQAVDNADANVEEEQAVDNADANVEEEQAVDITDVDVEEDEAIDNTGIDVEEDEAVDNDEVDVEEELGTDETETDELEIKDYVHASDLNDVVDEDLAEQGSHESDIVDNEDTINEDKSFKSEITESEFADSADSSVTFEPEQISEETEYDSLKNGEPVEEAINDSEEYENLNADHVNDASDADLDNNVEDTIDNIDDSRPADTPIMENDIEENVQTDIGDSRPVDLPHADAVEERDILTGADVTPDIVDDSTFDHSDVSEQTFSPPSSSKHKIDPNESTSQTTAFTKHQTISDTDGECVTKSFTSKPASTKTSRTKVNTKGSTSRPAAARHSNSRNVVSKASSNNASSKNPSKSKNVKSSEVTTPASIKTTPVETSQKTILSSKVSPISVPQSKIKSATKVSSKNTRIPKKSLSKRLKKSRTVRSKTTSQLHDEL